MTKVVGTFGIDTVFYSAVRQFRALGYSEVDCYKAAIAAMNGETYVPSSTGDAGGEQR